MHTPALLRRTVAAVGVLVVVASSLLVASPAAAADAPEIVITSPANGTVFGPADFISIEGYVTDPSVPYTISVNGGMPIPFTLWNGDRISLGVSNPRASITYTFTFAGGGTSNSVTFSVDADGPDVSITSPAENEAVRDSLSLDFTSADGISSWMAVDGDAEAPVVGAPPYLVDTSALSPGSHQLRVRSVDTFGNSTTATRNFVIDRTGPTVAITMPSDGAWVNPELPFTIMATSDEALTQTWDLRVDGVTVAGGPGGTPIGYGMPAPTSWTNGSTHSITAQATDALGNVGNLATVTVRADKRRPDVSIDVPTAALGRTGTGTVTGTASDTGSGVADVRVDFRKLRADDSCGAVQFSATAVVTGGTWSLSLPGSAVSGAYCLRATATDAVGHTRVASDQPTVVVDVTGPTAPTGLTPSGELWAVPTAIAWDANPDAVSYRYRLAATELELETADVFTTSGTSVTPAFDLTHSWFWQIQAVDALGNEGAWSAPQAVTVLGAPVLDGTCSMLCGIVGDELDLSWTPVPGAIGYRVVVRWPGEVGDPSDNISERFLLGPTTSATIALPDVLPSGMIVVQVRAVLDHRVEGRKQGPWSDKLRLLHVASPQTPALITPTDGAYVDGDAVELAWSDDSAVFAWEVRLASAPTLGSDGGLDTDIASPLLDPMVLLFILGGSSGSIPRDVDLNEVDAVLDCAAFWDFAGVDLEDELPIGCADGSFTIPETLADGHYYWQVRGYGISALTGDPAGPWSTVGHFIVGEAPAGPGGSTVPSSGTESGSGHGVVTPVGDPSPDEPESEEPPVTQPDSGDSSGGSDASGAGDPHATGGAESAAAGGEFPFGWLFAGFGGLVVLAGAGVFIRFLVVRSR
jgi:hypothetical protein